MTAKVCLRRVCQVTIELNLCSLNLALKHSPSACLGVSFVMSPHLVPGVTEKEQKSHELSCSLRHRESWSLKAKAHLHMGASRSFRGADHFVLSIYF